MVSNEFAGCCLSDDSIYGMEWNVCTFKQLCCVWRDMYTYCTIQMLARQLIGEVESIAFSLFCYLFRAFLVQIWCIDELDYILCISECVSILCAFDAAAFLVFLAVFPVRAIFPFSSPSALPTQRNSVSIHRSAPYRSFGWVCACICVLECVWVSHVTACKPWHGTQTWIHFFCGVISHQIAIWTRAENYKEIRELVREPESKMVIWVKNGNKNFVQTRLLAWLSFTLVSSNG